MLLLILVIGHWPRAQGEGPAGDGTALLLAWCGASLAHCRVLRVHVHEGGGALHLHQAAGLAELEARPCDTRL